MHRSSSDHSRSMDGEQEANRVDQGIIALKQRVRVVVFGVNVDRQLSAWPSNQAHSCRSTRATSS